METIVQDELCRTPLLLRSIAGHPNVERLSSTTIVDQISLGGGTSYTVPPSNYNLLGSCDNIELAAKIFTNSAQYTGAEIYVTVIDNCRVTPTGAIITQEGFLILESLYSYTTNNFMQGFGNDLVEIDGNVFLRSGLRDTAVDDPILYVRDVGEYGYFHWINSILPRFGTLKRIPTPTNAKYLVSSNTKFASQSLALLGVDKQDIIPLKGDLQCCKRLYFLSPWIIGGNHWTRPPEVKEFYTEFKDAIGVAQSSADKAIYLSRNDAAVRRLSNDDEIMRLLTNRGLDVVTSTGLDFQKQARLFNDVRLCVSVHGAGLSNLVFMQPGSAIIEIISPDRLWPTYRSLAARMGISYTAISGSRMPSSSSANAPKDEASTGNEDFSVSPEALEYALSVNRAV